MPQIEQKETREFTIQEFRVTRATDDEPAKIAGHAAVFNQLSEDLGGFREKIQPGAFKEAVKGDVRALVNHNSDKVLGRTKSGTLDLEEDDKGLAFELVLPDTQPARDLTASMERGDVDQMSFGFRTLEDKWETKDGEDVRTLVKVELFEVSPVTFPAYPQTDVALRSRDAWKQPETVSEDEKLRMTMRQELEEAIG